MIHQMRLSVVVVALGTFPICTSSYYGGNRGAFRLPGEGADHVHCTVEPLPGHIRCQTWDFGARVASQAACYGMENGPKSK